MPDVFTPEKRSWIMGRVKGRDTTPELLVRSLVHRLGFRFRLHHRKLPGHPDLILPRHRKVIFVNGCFWHGHKGCPRSARPSSNREFWERKLSGNIERDKQNMKELRRLGWKTLVIWECQTKKPEKVYRKLKKFLATQKPASDR